MMHLRLATLLCLVGAMLCQERVGNPGIVTIIDTRGIDVVKDAALLWARQGIASMRFENMHGDKPFAYNFTDLMIDSLKIGESSIVTSSPDNVIVSISNVTLMFRGGYSASRHFIGISLFKDSGTLHGNVTNLDLKLGLRFEAATSGGAKVLPGNCSAIVDDLHLTFTNTIYQGWLNVFADLAKNLFRIFFTNKICESVRSILTQSSSSPLGGMELSSPLFLGTNINLNLMRPPLVSSEDITFHLKGNCFPSSNPNVSYNIEAPPIPPFTPTNQMVRILISEYVINTLLAALEEELSSDHVISQQQISDYFKLDISVESVSPVLHNLAPFVGSVMQFVFSAPTRLTADVTTEGVNIAGKMRMEIEGFDKQLHQFVDVMSMTMEFNASIEVNLVGRRVAASIYDFSFQVVDSTGFPVPLIHALMDFVVPHVMVRDINKKIETGYELNDFFNFRIENPSLLFKENAIEIGTDLGVILDL